MSGTDAKDPIRHAAMERLRFIDSRLFWEARINRADLIAAFSISPAQAALDFRAYLERADAGVVYDTRAKSYVTTSDFRPVFPELDGREKLQELAAGGDPLTARLPRLERPLDAAIAAQVRRAARDRRRLLVDYQTFTRADAMQRWLAPALLIHDGERWHTRAWCFERQAWRDFVLARIKQIVAAEPAGQLPADSDWLDIMEVTLQPAPHLSPAQMTAVEREFGMTEGRLRVQLPRAMLIYANRRWGLDKPGSRIALTTE